ncbi:unnamed protein product [marine sediment metagenome]|uniref:Uncharacterized protein n=1 Tax=marine sediment metagenome TaxID=412755 RepID=X1KJ95_9ZZZZ
MKPHRGVEFERVVESTGLREPDLLMLENTLEDFRVVATILEIGIEFPSDI